MKLVLLSNEEIVTILEKALHSQSKVRYPFIKMFTFQNKGLNW